MNEIVIRFSDTDRKLVEDLIGAVGLLASVVGNSLPKETQAAVIAAATETHPLDASTAHLEPPAPAPDPMAAAPAPAPAPVSLAEFQKTLSTRCAESPDMRLKVQGLIRKYAECVSAIPEDKRSEVLATLDSI